MKSKTLMVRNLRTMLKFDKCRLLSETTAWYLKCAELGLNSIIIGNVISMCKGLGMIEENELFVHSKVDEYRVNYKGIEVIGFTGEFEINFKIPDFFGLGKGVSEGYGAVRSC